MRLDLDLLIRSLPSLLEGTKLSVTIMFFSMLLGLVIGLVMAMGRLSKITPLRWLSTAYVTFFRGTPVLVQIFLIYYGSLQMGIRLPALTAAIIALGFNSGAYQGEIFRAGIQSIEPGQIHAGLSLGLSPLQTFRKVVLPQAVIRVLPAFGNEIVILTKDSSLASFIAVAELTYRSRLIATRTFDAITMFMGTAIIYLILTYTLATLLGLLERRLKRW